MSDVTMDIEKMVQRMLPEDQYFIVDISIRGGRGKEKLTVVIDGDQGVDIAVCSEISRKLSNELDLAEVFEGSYTLEVTSPGLDFPLKLLRQYRKNIGRNVRVVLSDKSTVKGELKDVEEKGILIRKEPKKRKDVAEEIHVKFDDILKTNVLIAFK